MDTLTYVQRIAFNHYQNMAPFPASLDLAAEHLDGCPPERLRDGLASLHEWMAAVYRGIADAPDDFGMPCHPDLLPRFGHRYNASVAAFAAVPRLIFALGLFGVPREGDGLAYLQVDLDRLSAYCAESRLKKGPDLLHALGRYGLQVAPIAAADAGLEIRFSHAPDVASALPAFVKACCAFTARPTAPPVEFYRGDMRAMQPLPRRKRSLPITLADVLRPLDDEQALSLAQLDALVESLGFRAALKCSSLARGEWRGSYTSSRLGKTLFGFVVEEGRLDVHVMIGQTSRILPCLEQCPPLLREAFYTAHSCQACGKCKVGPVRVSLDRAARRLCNYALFDVPGVVGERLAGVKMLLEAQAGILKQVRARPEA